MARDTKKLEKYYENIPYGNKSLPWEIHGKLIQSKINEKVETIAQMVDAAKESGDNNLSEALKGGIYYIDKQGEILKGIKEEHAADIRTRSNWSPHGWDDNFFTENGDIKIDDNMKISLVAFNPEKDMVEEKLIDDVTEDWESIGDWMQTLSDAKQDLMKSKGGLNTPPPFDIDFFVNNLIKENWRSMIADPDPTLDPNGPSNGYRLQQILLEAADENGNIPADYNLDKNSFNPTHDTRLHNAISSELKRAFYGDEEKSGKIRTLPSHRISQQMGNVREIQKTQKQYRKV